MGESAGLCGDGPEIWIAVDGVDCCEDGPKRARRLPTGLESWDR